MKTLLTLLAITIAFAVQAFAGPPVNEKCPVCGKDGRLIFRSIREGKTVIFDCADCKNKFDKAPGKYKVEPKQPSTPGNENRRNPAGFRL